MKLTGTVIIILLLSCSANKISYPVKVLECKTDSYGFLTEAPSNWHYIKQEGIDSYIGKISIGNGDTIHFNMGYYSNKFEHPFFLNDLDIDEELIKTKTHIEYINDRKAKFLQHTYKRLNQFGIHFDSLWTESHGDIVRFSVYGKNISRGNQKQIEKSFRTIKFLKN